MRKKKRAITSLNAIIKVPAQSTTHNKSATKVVSSAIKDARAAIKKIDSKSYVKVSRFLPFSAKIGGFLPYLISFFAGLSATRALARGAAGVIKAINQAKDAKRQLEENHRHN